MCDFCFGTPLDYYKRCKHVAFPNISPEIFTITVFGINFSLRWYAISYILGFVCAIYLMKYFVGKVNLWGAQKPPMTEQADHF